MGSFALQNRSVQLAAHQLPQLVTQKMNFIIRPASAYYLHNNYYQRINTTLHVHTTFRNNYNCMINHNYHFHYLVRTINHPNQSFYYLQHT